MVKLPKYVQSALSRGLDLHRKGLSGDGLVPKTVRDAESGIRNGAWPEEKVKRAATWFARHKNDRMMMSDPKSWDKPPSYSPAYVAWLLWGDDGSGRGSKFMKERSMDIKLKEGGKCGVEMGVVASILKDLSDVVDMIDGVETDTIKSILIATIERYATMLGMGDDDHDDHDDYDDYDEGGYHYRKKKTRDAVDAPSASQRADLPAAAFEPSAFFDRDGDFIVSKSKLPHHVRSVKNPNDNESVDVPRLRNALARFDQVDWSGFPEGTERRSRAHLERHADAILKSRKEDGVCRTCSAGHHRKEDVDALGLDILDFRRGRYEEIRRRLV